MKDIVKVKPDIIPIINDETNYWIVRAGIEGVYFDKFYENNCIALGWDKIKCISEIRQLKSSELLKSIVRENYLEELLINRNEKSINRKVSDISNKIYKFINEIKKGDIVITPGIDKVLIGRVTSDTFLVEDKFNDNKSKRIGELNKVRNVDWVKCLDKNTIEPNLRITIGTGQGLAYISNEQVITEINRSLYDFYITNDDGHTIFRIKSQESIDFSKYANFIITINGIYELIKDDFEDKHLSIKTNIQSPGPIELIGQCDLVKTVLIAAQMVLKNNRNSMDQLSEKQIEKINKYKEDNPNNVDYSDYEFPSIGGY